MEATSQSAWMQVAEIGITYKKIVKPSERPVAKSSYDLNKLFRQAWDMDTMDMQEHFKIMMLNAGLKVLGIYNLSSGGLTGTVVDPKLVFAAALKAGAAAIALCHNHPSGNLFPSPQDINLTQKLKEGGKLLDIKIVDHLIISTEDYLSMADDGIL